MTLPPTSLSQLIQQTDSVASPSQARLQALYTFTSNQELTNPAGFENNVKWWSNVIQESLRSGLMGRGAGTSTIDKSSGDQEEEALLVYLGDRLGFEVDRESLGRVFEWTDGGLTGTGRPKGLACVINSDLSAHPPRYLPLSTFLSSTNPIHQPPSIASRYIAAPLWWGLSKLNPFGSSVPTALDEEKLWKRLKGVKLVHLGLVEESAQQFISNLASTPPLNHSSSLLTIQSFQARYSHLLLPPRTKHVGGKIGLSETDCKVLLRYLERDKGVVVGDQTGEVYKIVLPGTNASEIVVTEADRGTIAIMTTLDKLDRQIQGIHQEMISAQTKATSFLKQNQKTIALSYLRSKKQLESVLDKRIGTVEQLRTVLRKIDDAQGDVEIIKAYETSTSTLRAVLADPALQRDRVDATMDALSDALADQEEIDQAIQSGGQSAIAGTSMGGEIDEDDLEKELQGLVDEKQKEEEGKARMEEEERSKAQDNRKKEANVEERLARLRPVAPAVETLKSDTDRDTQVEKTVMEAV